MEPTPRNLFWTAVFLAFSSITIAMAATTPPGNYGTTEPATGTPQATTSSPPPTTTTTTPPPSTTTTTTPPPSTTQCPPTPSPTPCPTTTPPPTCPTPPPCSTVAPTTPAPNPCDCTEDVSCVRQNGTCVNQTGGSCEPGTYPASKQPQLCDCKKRICCVPTNSGGEKTCGARNGNCQNATEISCPGYYETGLCNGLLDIQCCLPFCRN